MSVETMASYQELPWDEIRGMRNRMTHAYFNFDNEFLIEADIRICLRSWLFVDAMLPIGG